jgi:hypothetical protein
MYTCLILLLAGVAYFVQVYTLGQTLMDRYKLASMFLPEASNLYINTRVTMVLFGEPDNQSSCHFH